MDSPVILLFTISEKSLNFSAMQDGEHIVEEVRLAPDFSDLNKYLNVLAEGFEQVKKALPLPPDAISFGFPGPADYPNGIIGDVPNMPLFRGGVALKAFLEYRFQLPVFINNNGDLFTYGESMAGFLPHINAMLAENGNPSRYRNLLGIMLGRGAGGGLVTGGELNMGDNAASTEIWCMRNKTADNAVFEAGVNAEYITHEYKRIAGAVGEFSINNICGIADGTKEGDNAAALSVFDKMGETLGAGLADILCVIDGLVVIGGAAAQGHKFFLPRAIEEMNSPLYNAEGEPIVRELTAFNLMNERERNSFLTGSSRKIAVPQTDITIDYDPVKRIGIGISVLGTEQAIALGAFYYALDRIKKRRQSVLAAQ